MTPVCVHLDLDAFFASVEQLDHPEWRGKPVIVGALPGRRGVVSTCSYEARAFGVRSAMPVSEAYRRCPQGIFTLPRMDRYRDMSRRVMDLVRERAPRFAQMSVDEAYLDWTGTTRLWGDPRETAERLKQTIHEQTGLRVSVGIAPTWYLAKIGSDWGKPDGLWVLTPADVDEFLLQLPLRKLHGVGTKTRERLERLGWTTVAELRTKSQADLQRTLGEAGGAFVFAASRGVADYDPFREAQSHSLSSERTFLEDTADPDVIRTTLLALCQDVFFRALHEGWTSTTPHLKLRWSDFTTVSAQTTLDHPVGSSSELFRVVRSLWESRASARREVRLLGVGLGSLVAASSARQGALFDQKDEKQALVERALAKRRPGGAEVTRAQLLGSLSRARPKR